MKRLMSMLAAVMGAMTTVWEYCKRTGRLVSRVARTPLLGGGGAPDYDEPPVVEPVAETVDNTLAGIRKLAGAIAANRETAADFVDVPDHRIEWLAAMDRPMLCRVLAADDQALKNHLAGKGSIRGVLAADKASVDAYNARMAMVMDDEPEDQPAYGLAA